MTTQVPCAASDAVKRALSIATKGGEYFLGSGDYRPKGDSDVPWTSIPGKRMGSDCAGFALSWCYQLTRHRPGYNKGAWASVADDINCNSALEDAQHRAELFRLLDADERPEPGDLVLYPTFTLNGSDGKSHRFIGHVGIVVGTSRVVDWQPGWNHYEQLDIAQCRGPNGRKPGVVLTDGSVWSHHDSVWPKKQHRSHLIRAQTEASTPRAPKAPKKPRKRAKRSR